MIELVAHKLGTFSLVRIGVWRTFHASLTSGWNIIQLLRPHLGDGPHNCRIICALQTPAHPHNRYCHLCCRAHPSIDWCETVRTEYYENMVSVFGARVCLCRLLVSVCVDFGQYAFMPTWADCFRSSRYASAARRMSALALDRPKTTTTTTSTHVRWMAKLPQQNVIKVHTHVRHVLQRLCLPSSEMYVNLDTHR